MYQTIDRSESSTYLVVFAEFGELSRVGIGDGSSCSRSRPSQYIGIGNNLMSCEACSEPWIGQNR
eukprot:scaffold2170_cov122-Cylindrotheca_fusiformis.AAC.1